MEGGEPESNEQALPDIDDIIPRPMRTNDELIAQVQMFPPFKGIQNKEYIADLYTLNSHNPDGDEYDDKVIEIAISEYATRSRVTLRIPVKVTSGMRGVPESRVY